MVDWSAMGTYRSCNLNITAFVAAGSHRTVLTGIRSKRILSRASLVIRELIPIVDPFIDIAFHVGFDNLTYFNRLFKKQAGFSPKEFRKLFSSKIFKDEDYPLDDELY